MTTCRLGSNGNDKSHFQNGSFAATHGSCRHGGTSNSATGRIVMVGDDKVLVVEDVRVG
jgi:hypothetical protein